MAGNLKLAGPRFKIRTAETEDVAYMTDVFFHSFNAPFWQYVEIKSYGFEYLMAFTHTAELGTSSLTTQPSVSGGTRHGPWGSTTQQTAPSL